MMARSGCEGGGHRWHGQDSGGEVGRATVAAVGHGGSWPVWQWRCRDANGGDDLMGQPG